MEASKQSAVAVCLASEGASLEVPTRPPEGLEHMTRLTDPLGLGRTLQAQGSRKPSHPIRLGHYKGVQGLSEKCSIEPPPHYFQQLTFSFQRLCFPSTRVNLSRFLRISTIITVT